MSDHSESVCDGKRRLHDRVHRAAAFRDRGLWSAFRTPLLTQIVEQPGTEVQHGFDNRYEQQQTFTRHRYPLPLRAGVLTNAEARLF